MRDIKDYIDERSLICQRKVAKDGSIWLEGGDSEHRTGFVGTAQSFKDKQFGKFMFEKRMESHEISKGRFVRNPVGGEYFEDETENIYKFWYNDPETTSRDQTTPCVVAAGIYDSREILWSLFISQIKQSFWALVLFAWVKIPVLFYQNWREKDGSFKWADIASPEHLGFYIRAFNVRGSYIPLLFCDVFSVFASISKLVYSRNPRNVDDNNRIVSLYQSRTVRPTVLSKLSLWIYKKRKSHCEGMSGPRYALYRYFGIGKWNDERDAPVAYYYDDILTEFFE